MSKLKIGVLGVSGHLLKRIMLPLSKSSTVEVSALASRNIEKAQKAASDWSIEKCYGSYEELLSDPEIEAVYIPLPNHLHVEWIKKSVDAGKHVICEKPLALNADEVKEIEAYVEGKKVKVMEAFMYRFHPKWEMVRELIKVNGIGEIKSIHTIFSYSNKDPKNIRNIKDYGGGALMDIGCYAISSARWILDREPSRVVSLNQYSADFGTDELSSGIMDFDGARCMFTVSTDLNPAQEVKVYGTGGSIEVMIPFNDHYDVPGQVKVVNDLGTRVVEFPPINQYGKMFEDFAKVIREDLEPLVTLEDSYMNMRILDQLVKSEESGGWENI